MLQPIWSFNPIRGAIFTNCFASAARCVALDNFRTPGAAGRRSHSLHVYVLPWFQRVSRRRPWGGWLLREKPIFFRLSSRCGQAQVSIQKTNGQLDTLLIFLLTAWLALLSCRGSNINPTTFMADSFRRHGFLMCFQFISSCLTSSFLGQHPQVET